MQGRSGCEIRVNCCDSFARMQLALVIQHKLLSTECITLLGMRPLPCGRAPLATPNPLSADRC